jgi:hypothetical protein
MNHDPAILCFPGWSYTQKIDQWYDLDITCINHLEQLQFINNDEPDFKLPENQWMLVTWSMGTWTALKLYNYFLKKNPPQCWIALSPFTDFCGGNAVSEKDLQHLIHAYKRKPEQTLKLFRKMHGGLELLSSEKHSPEDFSILEKSLEMLQNKYSDVPKIDIPVLILYGLKDTLIQKKMVESFKEHCSNFEYGEFENLNHALFYEQPMDIKTIIYNFYNKYF